jgi:hypothetical protein
MQAAIFSDSSHGQLPDRDCVGRICAAVECYFSFRKLIAQGSTLKFLSLKRVVL